MRQYMKNGHILTVHNPVQSQDNVFSAMFLLFCKKACYGLPNIRMICFLLAAFPP